MARPKKDGLDYFPLDTDMFSDEKVWILKARYGTDGIALYLYVLCRIYRNGYYTRYDEDFEYIAAEELGMSIAKVKQVMTFLFSRSLLTKRVSTLVIPDTIITSHGIQRRYQQAVKNRALKTPVAVEEAFWLLEKSDTESFIKVTHHAGFSEKNRGFFQEKQGVIPRKTPIKESKVNNYIFYSDPELNDIFRLFIQMRNEQKGIPLSEEQIRMLKEELDKIADTDAERIEVCRKAYVSGWRSFYPLPKRKDPAASVKQNGFHNFDQRSDVDYGALEEALTGRGMKNEEF